MHRHVYYHRHHCLLLGTACVVPSTRKYDAHRFWHHLPPTNVLLSSHSLCSLSILQHLEVFDATNQRMGQVFRTASKDTSTFIFYDQ